MTACNLPPATSEKNDSIVRKSEKAKDSGANVTPEFDMALLNEASDAVLNLPEIKSLAKHIYKKSHGRNKLKASGFGIGTQGTRTYTLVHVFEDNGSSLVSLLMFYYYPDDRTILNIDKETNSTLSLAEWRKTKVNW
jgi:hypothetical protein